MYWILDTKKQKIYLSGVDSWTFFFFSELENLEKLDKMMTFFSQRISSVFSFFFWLINYLCMIIIWMTTLMCLCVSVFDLMILTIQCYSRYFENNLPWKIIIININRPNDLFFLPIYFIYLPTNYIITTTTYYLSIYSSENPYMPRCILLKKKIIMVATTTTIIIFQPTTTPVECYKVSCFLFFFFLLMVVVVLCMLSF